MAKIYDKEKHGQYTADRYFLYRAMADDSFTTFERINRGLDIIIGQIQHYIALDDNHTFGLHKRATKYLSFSTISLDKYRRNFGDKHQFKPKPLTATEFEILTQKIEFCSKMIKILLPNDQMIFSYLVASTMDLYTFTLENDPTILWAPDDDDITTP